MPSFAKLGSTLLQREARTGGVWLAAKRPLSDDREQES
jgi:hypothetical protein